MCPVRSVTHVSGRAYLPLLAQARRPSTNLLNHASSGHESETGLDLAVRDYLQDLRRGIAFCCMHFVPAATRNFINCSQTSGAT
jgi:hypothetical protein